MFNIIFFSLNDADGFCSSFQHEFKMAMSFNKLSNQILFSDDFDISLEKKADTNQNRCDEMKTLSIPPSGNIPKALAGE